MAFRLPRWPRQAGRRVGRGSRFSRRTSLFNPGAAVSESDHREADGREDSREEAGSQVGESKETMQDDVQEGRAGQEEQAMTMDQEANGNDGRARAQGPPGARPGYGLQRCRG